MNYIKGDLLSVKSGIIVHGCNAQGVFGSGCALAVKQKYPEAYKKYAQDIRDGMHLGGVSWYIDPTGLQIGSAITQEFYGRDSNIRYVSYDAIEKAMHNVFFAAKWKNVSVAIPYIGSGLGNGSWSVISAIILDCAKRQKYSEDMINIFEL